MANIIIRLCEASLRKRYLHAEDVSSKQRIPILTITLTNTRGNATRCNYGDRTTLRLHASWSRRSRDRGNKLRRVKYSARALDFWPYTTSFSCHDKCQWARRATLSSCHDSCSAQSARPRPRISGFIYVGYSRPLTGNHRLRMCTYRIDRAHRQLRIS